MSNQMINFCLPALLKCHLQCLTVRIFYSSLQFAPSYYRISQLFKQAFCDYHVHKGIYNCIYCMLLHLKTQPDHLELPGTDWPCCVHRPLPEVAFVDDPQALVGGLGSIHVTLEEIRSRSFCCTQYWTSPLPAFVKSVDQHKMGSISILYTN